MSRKDHNDASPRTIEELEDLLGPLIEEQVIVEEHTFLVYRPDEAKSSINPGYRTLDGQAYQPFWTELWPASRMLSKAILREPWPAGTQALEIGCGLGLPGIAALARGLRVVFTDYDENALSFAAANARLNGFEHFNLLRLDWHDPPVDLRVPVLLASDLIYELVNVVPLVELIRRLLIPGGICLLTDQDRVPSTQLREELGASGLTFRTQTMRAGEPGGRRFRGTLYRISHAPRAI
jgi:predicted nicotinamide N-methyase